MKHKHIVSQKCLLEHLDDPQLVIADCRFHLGQPEKGQMEYNQDHIPGALYLDLEKDLSGPVREHGGRHPLPATETFAAKLGQYGIDATKTVVAYDDQDGAMAARLWWMLRYMGHTGVYVLDEGYRKWKQNGYPVTSEVVRPQPAVFIPQVNDNLTVSMQEVADKLNDPNVLIIDSRSHDRYIGEHEPIDRIGGHIPGAKNEFWKEGLDESGSWKSSEEQRERLEKYAARDKEIIVYCGSGVTACANVIAFEEAGLIPRLYVGSWSDWITHSHTPKKTP